MARTSGTTMSDEPPSAQPAFDAAAATYDATFSDSNLAALLRAAVRRRLSMFAADQRVLELGCGTGEDALWLARRGVAVAATDVSPAMVAVTTGKARAADLQITTAVLDLAAAGTELPSPLKPPFDGAFSSFGPLNCVRDRVGVASNLAAWLRPGARVVLVVMGPLCPWEWLWYGARMQPTKAMRRWRPGKIAHAGGGGMLPVWYPSAHLLRSEFMPWFRHVQTSGVGVLLPPSDAIGLVRRLPRVFAGLARIERGIESTTAARWLNDHYVCVLERR